MQQTYNAAWYAGNETRPYPLKESLIPDALLTELKLISTVQREYWVSGVTVTEYLISIVIASNQGLEAALTLPKPVKPLTHYKLECFSDTLQGVVAFGHTDTLGQWRIHGTLADGCVLPLRPWPVASLNDLAGDIILASGTDLEITRETIRVGDTRAEGATASESHEALVIRLKEGSFATKESSFATKESSASRYLGGCCSRPDNGDCPYITSIGGCKPNDGGDITLQVQTDALTAHRYNNPPYADILTLAAETTCVPGDTSCSAILLDIQEPETVKPPMQFSRCGADTCQETPEAVQTFSLPSEAVPLTDSGLLYTEEEGMAPEADEPSIAITGVSGSRVTASFTLQEGSTCGIVYRIQSPQQYELFSLHNSLLKLGEQTTAVNLTSNSVSLKLSCTENQLTGELWSQGNLTAVLSGVAVTLGDTGIYLDHCTCTQWSVTQ